MRKHYIIITLAFLSFQLDAQQYVDFIQVKNDLIISNPAAPTDDYLRYGAINSIVAVHKDQWLKFENSPRTYGLQYRNMYEPMNIAVGLTLLKDDTGAISNHNILANFAYTLIFDKAKMNRLSFGFSGGISQYTINLSAINFAQTPNISLDVLNDLSAEIGFGTFFTIINKFYGGIAIPQLWNTKNGDIGEIGINEIPHFIGKLGGYINLRDVIIEPQLNISYQSNVPFNLMGGILLRHNSGIQIGGGFNTVARPNFTIGYTYKTNNDALLTASIAYGDRLDTLRSIVGGTIEAQIIYSWGKSNYVYCPQF